MFGDNSPRTKSVARHAIMTLGATALAAISTVGLVIGSLTYNSVVAKSSTPIGTNLTFKRSNASVKIADVYTDLNNDVLIVRLSNTSNGTALPFKGTDYSVFIKSNDTKNLEEMSILFGKMSTDGDMFLIIPKPSKEVYSVFVMNTKYLAGGDDVKSNSSDKVVDLESASISFSQAVNAYKFNDSADAKNIYNVVDDRYDVISFRVTLDPALRNEAYVPKQLQADLLDDDHHFDFNKFFNVVFKQSAINTLQSQYATNAIRLHQLAVAESNMRERLKVNPLDSEAKSRLSTLTNEIENLNNQQLKISSSISQYSALQLTENTFTDLQTKAKVLK